jgi:undecaprenyl pyrophosphate synthase
MEKEKTILFANVKIPIEVKDDGSIEPLKEHIIIDFSKCNELPPKQETEVNYSFLMNNIKELLQTEKIKTNTIEMSCQTYEDEFLKEEAKIMVLKSEIKNNSKQKINTSFKSNPKQIIRNTVKNYS